MPPVRGSTLHGENNRGERCELQSRQLSETDCRQSKHSGIAFQPVQIELLPRKEQGARYGEREEESQEGQEEGLPRVTDSREIFMDLDLNCSPPSPEPAVQEDLNRLMLLQHHTFRHQVKDLHGLYWAHNNLTDVPPFWKQSDGVLYAAHRPPHPSHMVNFDDSGVFSRYRQGKYGFQHDHYGVVGNNLDVKGPIRGQPDPPIAQGMRSAYRCVIDLEKPATLDDDVEIVSSQHFINYASCNGVFPDNSHCVPLESSPVVGDLCRDHSTPYASYGSSGSSDTSYSHSPVRTKTSVSGRMLFDLNVAQENDFNIFPGPSKAPCSLLASSATRNTGGCCNNSNKTFHQGSESSIGSSKGSSVTVGTAISFPDGGREVMAAGLFCDSQSSMPFSAQTSKYNALLKGNMHHQQTLDKNSGLDAEGCMEIPQISSVTCNGENNSSSGIYKLGDNQAANLTGQVPVAGHREPQEDIITVISDSEMEVFDLNVAVESIDLPSKAAGDCRGKRVNDNGSDENSSGHYFTQNQGQPNVSLVECLTSTSHHLTKADEDVQSPASEIAINRSVLIPKTPQGRDSACPRLRSSSNRVLIQLETVCIHQAELGEDERSVAKAAETLVSIFAANSAYATDSHGSNSQTDARDGNHEPLISLDSFEKNVLSLEELKDDGESIPVRPPDKDGPSCGIRLKRGRGLRDFQREILPGLVTLARHEICDDLHSIGYEIRKTRSRSGSGDQGTPPTRTRLPRRCSTAWNR
ncbi:hypothetical protein EJB05_08340, partial [Eragrostis curvula]